MNGSSMSIGSTKEMNFTTWNETGEEKQNLIGSPVYAQKIAAMKEEVLRFLVETCDTVPVLPDARE